MSAALEVRCPLCDAPPNEPCVQFTSGMMHQERLTSAAEFFKRRGDDLVRTAKETFGALASFVHSVDKPFDMKLLLAGTTIVHPSQIRDRLRQLGLAIFDVAQDEQLSDFAADNAIWLALNGGPEFEKAKGSR